MLCAWGSDNILDGGSGNDLLVAQEGPVNTFLGGSGNDTMIGIAGDSFNGGSGRNEPIARDPAPELNPVITLFFSPYVPGLCDVGVELTGFAPNTAYDIAFEDSHLDSPVTTDGNGNRTLGQLHSFGNGLQTRAWIVGMEDVTTGLVTVAC